MSRPGPPTDTKSIRATAEFWARMERHALDRGRSMTALLIEYAEHGMRGGNPHQVLLPDDPPPGPQFRGATSVVRRPAKPLPGPDGYHVQVGPSRTAPGARLKK